MTDRQEQLLLKLLNDTISGEERASLQAWIDESPDNKKLVHDFTVMWRASKPPPEPMNFETSDEWIELEAAIDQSHAVAKQAWWSSPIVGMKVAASIAFFALASWLLYYIAFNDSMVVAESKKTIVSVTLPDGSEVWLNQDSRLAYQDDFNSNHRTVTLHGEALFNVKKDSVKPFIIQANGAEVKVLGTVFNVQAYDSVPEIEVFVSSGAVSFTSLNDRSATVTLSPGEIGTLTKKNHVIAVHADENVNTLAWKNKKLVFKSTSMEMVVKNVGHYFKVNIDVRNRNILRCRFTGSFNQPTLEEIVEALSVSLDLTITKNGDTYVVDGDGC
jgi:ferric-dicitrate binding protein FerR (iron transport regulator)